jgi:hypothetical protein
MFSANYVLSTISGITETAVTKTDLEGNLALTGTIF